MIIDTHSHLYQPAFDADRHEAIDRAKRNGVGLILLPNIDLESIPRMEALVGEYPTLCKAMYGLHPCSVTENWPEVMEEMEALLKGGKAVAVGETGIDMYWDKTTLPLQREAFIRHIDLAKTYDLPLVIHARESFAELFEVLDQHADERLRGVFHCFTGGRAEADHIAGYANFYYGIGGVLTYKNSGLPEVLPHINRQRLLLETDAPYLSPVPHRGKRNEPAFLVHVVETMADALGIPVAEVEALTEQNARNLFRL